ncbi:MAG TPA: tetratricopeptide repeat protein [Sphingomicrobium sp.]
MDCSPVVLAHEAPFRIGDAEFRPATREVVRKGGAAIIDPRVMQLLVALRRADGGVVTKDDLTKLVWEGRIIGEDAINRVVSRLRAVAGKEAGGQFRVETITKVGYRLVPGNGAAAVSPVVPRQPGSLSRRTVIAGSAVGIAAAAGLGWTLLGGDRLPREARILLDDAKDAMHEGRVDQTSDAIGKLRQAAQIAPDAAEIWGLLALAYMKQADQAPSTERFELRERGTAAIKRALALEPNQADALAAYVVAMRKFRNWYAVEQASRAALRHHRDHPELQLGLADVLFEAGRTREALEVVERAARDMPPSPRIAYRLNVMLWDLGRFDEADVAMTRSFALWPRHFAIWFSNLYYRMYNGKAAEAAAMTVDVATRPVGIPDWNFDLVAQQANALASGDASAVRRAIEASAESARRGTGFAANAATFAGYLGDFDTAFRMLDALYFNRGFAMPDVYFAREQGIYAGTDRHTSNLFRRPLQALRRDSRFAALTRAIGLEDYWARTNSRSLVIS